MFVSNATCRDLELLNKDREIAEHESILISCTRDKDFKDSIYINLNTSQGATGCVVPTTKIKDKTIKKTLKEYIEECSKNNPTSCAEIELFALKQKEKLECSKAALSRLTPKEQLKIQLNCNNVETMKAAIPFVIQELRIKCKKQKSKDCAIAKNQINNMVNGYFEPSSSIFN